MAKKKSQFGIQAGTTDAKIVDKCNGYLEKTRSRVTGFCNIDINITRMKQTIKEHETQLTAEKKALRYLIHVQSKEKTNGRT